MVVRYTKQGCTVDTKFIIQPNGQVREEIELSVDPASQLSLVTEEYLLRGASAQPQNLPRLRR